MAQQRIEIILETIVKGQKQARAMIQSMETLRNGTQRLTESTFAYGKRSKKIPEILDRIKSGSITAEQGIVQMKKAHAKLTKTQTKTTKGMHRFRMELLGVMFFGMMLSRTFGSLIRKQFELFGITEVFSAMMTIVMLPVMQELSDILLPIILGFGDLDENVKKAITWFIILAAIVGTGLMIFGQFGLGITSLKATFPALFGIIGKAGGVFGLLKTIIAGIFTPIGALVAAIIIVIIGMVIAWKENFMGMKTVVANIWKGIKAIFKGAIDVITGIFQFFIAVFKGDFEGAKEAVIKIFKGLLKIIAGLFMVGLNISKAILIGIIRIVWGIVKTIVGFFVWLWNKLVGHSIIRDIVQGIIDFFASIPRKIMGFIKSIPTKILNVFKGIGSKIASKFQNMIPSWMLKIFKAGGTAISGIGKMFGFQYGGIVPGRLGAPVPILAHGGERVIPVGGGGGAGMTFAPVITVYATVSSEVDIHTLADKLSRYWVSDFEKITKSRGII